MNLRDTTGKNPTTDIREKDRTEKTRGTILRPTETDTPLARRPIFTGKDLLCRLTGILLVLAMTGMTGCLRPEEETVSPETPAISESVEETADPSWRFEDRFSARQACLNALDLIHHIKHYDSEALKAYQEYQNEVRELLYDDTATQAAFEALYPQIIEKKSTLALQRGDIARVYISRGNAGQISHSYSACNMGFVPAQGEEGEELSFLHCEIRIRGNSTSAGPKFPYSFKLPYNESLFGMDSGKRWCLLANLFDMSLMRGNIGFHLAAEMDCPYTSQSTFVEVYLDGVYIGNYELVEAISDAGNRVDVDTDNNEMILEIDWNRDDGSYYFKTPMGLRFKVDRPEQITSAQKKWLQEFLEKTEAAMAEDSDRYLEYVDMDSFVNVYLNLEYTKNLDSNNLSTRYFIKDGKLYAGPVWDFDLSAGNVSPHVDEEGYRIYLNIQGRGDNSGDSTRGLWNREGWFKVLFEHKDFADAVAARYRELRPLFENVYADNELGESWIGQLQDRYGASFRRNFTVWDITQRYTPYHMDPGMNYDEHVQFLKDWFKGRLAYLDSVYLE